MPPDDGPSPSERLTPSTPGVWQVSHTRIIDQGQAQQAATASPPSSFELVTDVSFVWSYPASSAFVTGTFSNWEKTEPMKQMSGADGTVWVFSKALSPGEYQYKFIIDNVWRHAPDQQITFDERGIINNVLSVTVESCGDATCFCLSFFGHGSSNNGSNNNANENGGVIAEKQRQLKNGIMTPQTMANFQRRIGVAYKYVEHAEPRKSYPVRKSYMHTEISDRTFDVTVVNVNSIKDSIDSRKYYPDKPTEGTISRASSFEHINQQEAKARLDPNVPVIEDAAYAAVLNDQDGSLPHTAPYRAYAFSGDPTELAYSVRAKLSSPVLGFSATECSEGIQLLNTNHCAVRVHERGLYKSVRAVLPVRSGGQRVYYEFFVLRQAPGGGVCLGLATRELPLNCLCGTRPNSIGFCTSGSLIRTVDGKEKWTAFGSDVGSGSTVGCLVRLTRMQGGEGEENLRNKKEKTKAEIEFFVDGRSRGNAIDYTFVGDLDIFPTLSLFAKNSRVYSLFNGPDMLFPSCLPPHEDIRTLDGRDIKAFKSIDKTPESLGLVDSHGNNNNNNNSNLMDKKEDNQSNNNNNLSSQALVDGNG